MNEPPSQKGSAVVPRPVAVAPSGRLALLPRAGCEDCVLLKELERHLTRLHVLKLGVGHGAVHHLCFRVGDVDEVPLAGVVEQPHRLEDGDEALAGLEAAGRRHGVEVPAVLVGACVSECG